MSTPKELNFFIAERNYPRGLEWYSRHFDATARCRGEASPNYTAYPQHLGVPERIAAVVPDVRLVYIVRDPIERITAHFVHNFAKRREKGDLRATLMHPEHLLRDPQQVLHAAAAVPRALRRGADPRPRSARSPRRPDADAAAALRVRRRRSRLPAPEVRAGPPLHLPQEARDAARDAGPADEPDPVRAADPAPCLARARRGPATLEADRASRPASPRRSVPRRSRSCTRTPTGCGPRPAARSTIGRCEQQQPQEAEEQEPQRRVGAEAARQGRRDRRGARHAGASATPASTASGCCSATSSRSPRRSSSPTSPSPASSASSACSFSTRAC